MISTSDTPRRKHRKCRGTEAEEQQRDCGAAVRVITDTLSRLTERLQQKRLAAHDPIAIDTCREWLHRFQSIEDRAHRYALEFQLHVVYRELLRLPDAQDNTEALTALLIAGSLLRQWTHELERGGLLVNESEAL